MSPEVLAAFIATCILLGLTPGPNMSLILASTLSSGLRAGLVTVAGTTTGLALLVGAATAGMSSVMVFMSEWFDVIRWIGALYLVYLGARQLWLFRQRRVPGFVPPKRSVRRQPLFRGPAGQPVEPQGAAVPGRLPAAVHRSGPRCRVPALGAGGAVRRRAGGRRRRLHADGRPGAGHLRRRPPAPARRRRRRSPLLGGLALAMARRP